jgi:sugar fermentation stimulation protein A
MIPQDARIARFLARSNRFVLRCDLDGKTIDAYLPNPGRLWELLLPGCVLYLARNRGGVKLPYTVVAMEKDGIPILLHTHLANDAAETLLRRGLVPGLEDARILRREATFGDSRFDFLLEKDGREMVLEVKNCTLFGRTLAMFPDAVTRRGSRHLEGLMRLASSGVPAGVLFLVQWPHARYFMPEYHTDLVFSRTFARCRDRILVEALALTWNADLSLNGAVRRLAILWERIERECRDGGCYILILKLDEDTRITTGGLGDVLYKKGYYLYAGSAKKGLTKRMERHARKRKKLFWHIDYLREKASFHKVLAIRTVKDIECVLAAGLKRISRWSVPGFGCSDCCCASHLFGMDTDPIVSPDFISFVYDHRIGSIERELRSQYD